MINPGSRPVGGATEAEAANTLAAFIDAATELGLQLDGEPERRPEFDEGGRYAWTLPRVGGSAVQVLIPGVGAAQLRDDLSAQAYCIRVGTDWWWWGDAVNMVVP